MTSLSSSTTTTTTTDYNDNVTTTTTTGTKSPIISRSHNDEMITNITNGINTHQSQSHPSAAAAATDKPPHLPKSLSIHHLQSLPSSHTHQLQSLHRDILQLSYQNVGALMESLRLPGEVRGILTREMQRVLMGEDQSLGAQGSSSSSSSVAANGGNGNASGTNTSPPEHSPNTSYGALRSSINRLESLLDQKERNNGFGDAADEETLNVNMQNQKESTAPAGMVTKSENLHHSTSLNQQPSFQKASEQQQDPLLTSSQSHLNHLLLNHTDQIESLMQIPSLMQSCLVQELYNEVLDLYQYLCTLQEKYGVKNVAAARNSNGTTFSTTTRDRNASSSSPQYMESSKYHTSGLHHQTTTGIPILSELMQQSRHIMQRLMRKIVYQLRMSKLTVPQCLRLVNILKRLDLCSERELRVVFLQNRLKSLRELYKQEHAKFLSIPSMDSLEKDTLSNFIFQYLLDLTRSLKSSLFPVITQYRAMFPDTEQIEDQMILTSCIHYHVTLPYVNVLKEQLKHISSAEKLARLADECQYTSQTLAKIGADLRHLVQQDFFEAMQSHVFSLCEAALHDFTQNMRTFNWQPTDTSYATTITKQQEQLLKYRPISLFTNALLSTLNEVREFPLIQLKTLFLEKLTSTIRGALECCNDLKQKYPFDDTERSTFLDFVSLLGESLPKYIIVNCLANIYELNKSEQDAPLREFSTQVRSIQEF